MKLYRWAPWCAVLLLAAFSCACSRLKARDQLNKGVGAFRNASFQSAIMHFKNAVALDPTLLNARLYLATAYAQLYIPGGDSPENNKNGQQAIDAFEEVLKMDPNNTTAIASTAQIYYNMKNFDKAKEYQRRRMQIEPNNSEPYYWVGVINWAITYKRSGELRRDLNMNIPNPQGELPPLPEKARAQLETDNGALVEEGLKALQKAIDLKPNHSDAMAYINLMYRQKAEIETDKDAREADLKLADEWVNKALAIKKQAGQLASTTGQ